MKTNFLQNMMLPLVASTFFATEAFAQTINVKGVVKDEAGIPVIGANVIQKGTTNGVITDLDGNFTLEVPELYGTRIARLGDDEHHPTRGFGAFGRSRCHRLRASKEGGCDRIGNGAQTR